MVDYTLKDLKKTIQSLINIDNEVVFITGSFSRLGVCFKKKEPMTKTLLMDTIYDAVMEVSKNITIVVPTHTINLCNTETVFNKYTYTNMGVFSNYIIHKKHSVRSMHPFASYTAIGKNSNKICGSEILPFPYGINSPYDNILKLNNPIAITIGLAPNLACSIIHHVEANMYVPYRYIKEFYHPIELESGDIIMKNFYLHVLYKGLNEKRNLNVKAFDFFEKKNKHKVVRRVIGRNSIYCHNLKDFYDSCIELYQSDIYTWLEDEPLNLNKPYRQ